MIDVAMKEGIAVLTMRYGKANALDIEFCDALAQHLSDLARGHAKGVLLTGQGTMFSAGVDLKRASSGGADYLRKFLPSLHRLYNAAFNLPKPLIAAINGHAVAGGAVLAACADRRIMAQGKARIGTTELQVGVPFPALAFEIVRFAVPSRCLPEFTLGAATYGTEDALERGWVDEVVEAEALMPRAFAVAQQYGALSPPAFAQTKKQIRHAVAERYAQSGEATDKTVTGIWCADATLGYLRDYVARTLKKS
jgi:enoyl-CoA hydratase